MRKTKSKKIICCIVCLVLAISFFGCAKTITEGEVYEKEYKEEHTSVMMLPLVISNGKTTTTTMIPYVVYYPDRYVIRIKAYCEDRWETEDFYVSKSVYDEINIGDMFYFDAERGDLDDEPYTKTRQRSD